MNCLSVEHAKILYLRFCAIYGEKFVKSYHDDDFKSIWAYEWSSGLHGVDVAVIKNALENCKKTMFWPPSIAEFRVICEKLCGLPDLDEVINCVMNKKFIHPVILFCYEGVGVWSLKNDSEKEIKVKFQKNYDKAVIWFRENNEKAWEKLNIFNDCNNGLLECLGEDLRPTHTQHTNTNLKLLEIESRPVLDGIDTHTVSSNKNYEDYLISLPESDAANLDKDASYYRLKLISKDYTEKKLKEIGYVPYDNRVEFEQRRSNRNGPSKIYNSWFEAR